MLLSDGDLRKALAEGELTVEPWAEPMVQPASIELHLDHKFLVAARYPRTVIDPLEEQAQYTQQVVVPEGGEFILHPGELVLASTFETVGIGHSLAARLEGKSSLGRLGLLIHVTAGFIDPGFIGTITMELSNVAGLPIRLRPGMKIGQLCVFKMSSPVEKPYGSPGLGSHYQYQHGPTEAR